VFQAYRWVVWVADQFCPELAIYSEEKQQALYPSTREWMKPLLVGPWVVMPPRLYESFVKPEDSELWINDATGTKKKTQEVTS